LAFVEVAHGANERRQFTPLLSDFGGRWMLARGGEIDAVTRTLNLDEPLGTATGGADLVAERRASPPRSSAAAEWTNHNA
jgi:hypothetical protein